MGNSLPEDRDVSKPMLVFIVSDTGGYALRPPQGEGTAEKTGAISYFYFADGVRRSKSWMDWAYGAHRSLTAAVSPSYFWRQSRYALRISAISSLMSASPLIERNSS